MSQDVKMFTHKEKQWLEYLREDLELHAKYGYTENDIFDFAQYYELPVDYVLSLLKYYCEHQLIKPQMYSFATQQYYDVNKPYPRDSILIYQWLLYCGDDEEDDY